MPQVAARPGFISNILCGQSLPRLIAWNDERRVLDRLHGRPCRNNSSETVGFGSEEKHRKRATQQAFSAGAQSRAGKPSPALSASEWTKPLNRYFFAVFFAAFFAVFFAAFFATFFFAIAVAPCSGLAVPIPMYPSPVTCLRRHMATPCSRLPSPLRRTRATARQPNDVTAACTR